MPEPRYHPPDYLLTDENKIVRNALRNWIDREVRPVIDGYAQKAEFPMYLISGMGEPGTMGIRGEFHVMQHMVNLESVVTNEGTHDIHLLITGEKVTAISSFV